MGTKICRGSGQRIVGTTAQPLKKEKLMISRMWWSIPGFVCKTEAGMATAQAVRTGILCHACLAVSKVQAMREKVSSKGSQAVRKVMRKERGLIYEWRGSISIQPMSSM